MKRVSFVFVLALALMIKSISFQNIQNIESESFEEDQICRQIDEFSQNNCKKCLSQDQLIQMQQFQNAQAKKYSQGQFYDYSNNIIIDRLFDGAFDIMSHNPFYHLPHVTIDDFYIQFSLPNFEDSKLLNPSISFMQTVEITKIEAINQVGSQQAIVNSEQSYSDSSNSGSFNFGDNDELIIIIFIIIGIFIIPYPFLYIMRKMILDYGYNLHNLFLFSVCTSLFVAELSIQLYYKFKNQLFLFLNLYTIGALTASTSLLLGNSEFGINFVLLSTLFTFLVLFYYLIRTGQFDKQSW
ncbi:transmembrane protein, putative (macronuclear) [Tetrahymena thermophila SB210]|uniref:Transmembrane protein, putative n=1 Tax=Tetrahymena thermophila (strain SB210) TaxID=312017 RepID=I7M4K5_TETTS|nr:transmembrane protein, putative [Tetrahymena thermophila SB210]EAS07536.1 transmembrane protein, putative [Tetrahymena thermophila SB210]|eukprot:XP_001027778.1 transmembrane protein, putative [Tetrahymena thermophila SB210]